MDNNPRIPNNGAAAATALEAHLYFRRRHKSMLFDAPDRNKARAWDFRG
jgi:hypothetical protein